MTPAIQAIGLSKRYGSHTALHGLDLEVAPGTVHGLIGPNGAGKTTALRLLLDIIRPSAGEIAVLGVAPRMGGATLRRRIGFVPGELRLHGRMRGETMLRQLAAISGETSPSTMHDIADRLGLDLQRKVHTLSKGNKQKLGLVQAFMHRPELLILDEPTSGLDPLVQRTFLEMVREARDGGQTVLLSSHVLSEVQQAADRVAVLAEGRLVAEGDVASLRAASVRRLRATITDAAPEAIDRALRGIPGLDGVDVRVTSDGALAEATVRGEVDALVKALAQYRVAEVTIEEPDLEESVLALYHRGEDRA